jgi:hypothetical protein
MRRPYAALAALVVALVLLSGGVGAHEADLMKPARAGPIRRGVTTVSDLKNRFGKPTVRKVVRVGCVRVTKARWGRKLMVYAERDGERTVAAIFVKKRTLRSRLGELSVHTRKGLRVGDRDRRLQRLYPRSKGTTHNGHTHYRLKRGRYGAYLMAKVVRGKVVQLEAWPYEFC